LPDRPRRRLVVLPLAALALMPMACSRGDEPAQEQTPQAASAGPDAPAGISVTDARLVLPAVRGNPAALYFAIANNGAADAALASAHVAGAGMAMLHTTSMEGMNASMEHVAEVPVPAGETVEFAPGGMHVMVYEPGETLAAGGTTEVTLTLASGDKISFPAALRAAGDAS